MTRVLVAAGALGAILWSGHAAAQKLELASMSGQYMPGVRLAAPQTGRVQVSSYDVALNVPAPLGRKTFLVPGLGYHVDSVSFADTPPDFIDLKAFHSIEVPLLFVQLLPRGWSLSARLAPGVAGDLQSIDARLLRLGLMAMVTHSFSEQLVLGAGGVGSFSFGTFLPLPALYMDWKPRREIEVEAFLPAFFQFRYTIANRVRFGWGAEFNGNQYAVRDARIREQWPCAARSSDDPSTPFDEAAARRGGCFDNLAYSVGSAGPLLGVRLFSTLWLHGTFAQTFYRRFDQRNADGEQLPGGGENMPNGFLIRAGLVWRMPER